MHILPNLHNLNDKLGDSFVKFTKIKFFYDTRPINLTNIKRALP